MMAQFTMPTEAEIRQHEAKRAAPPEAPTQPLTARALVEKTYGAIDKLLNAISLTAPDGKLVHGIDDVELCTQAVKTLADAASTLSNLE